MEIIKAKKIKPLIGFRIEIKCDSQHKIKYLKRDQPKMMTRINTPHPIEKTIGIHRLCQAFRDLKSANKMALNVSRCDSHQLRIFIKWLKTSRNLKTFELTFPWEMDNPEKRQIEIIFHLKDVKNLHDLTLTLWDTHNSGRPKITKPFLKLHHLNHLRKLKINGVQSIPMPLNTINCMSLLYGLKRLYPLSKLDLDFSFINSVPDEDIPKFMESLKRIKDLTSFRVYFQNVQSPSKVLIEELSSYISSLQKLEAFYLFCSTWLPIDREDIEKITACLETKKSLKTLVLSTPSHIISSEENSVEQGNCLNLKGLNQLKYLKFSLFGDSERINSQLLQDVAGVLKVNPLLETLDLELRLRPLITRNFTLFCQSLQILENLTSLTFSLSNTLDSPKNEHIKFLTESLKSLKSLSNLHLSCEACVLSSKSVVMIAESVEYLQDLKTFKLNMMSTLIEQERNIFSLFKKTRNTGLGSFGPVFQKHKSLSSITLLLSNLRPNDEEIEALASGVGALQTLKNFEFDACHLFCLNLKNLERSLRISTLSCLHLEFKEVTSQDLESLFGILQGAKNLKKLELRFWKVLYLSEKAIENFIKMIQGFESLNWMKLVVFWNSEIDIEMISRFFDGLKYFDHFVDCFWRCNGSDYDRCMNILRQNSNYLKPLPAPVRYRFHRQYQLE